MKRGIVGGTLFAALLLAFGCSVPRPTPYQPLAAGGGYEQTRLQENMYRVSFKGNRYTPETDVLDFLYLRCAELTLEAGFSHFVVVESFGKINVESVPRSTVFVDIGPGHRRSAFWGFHDVYGSGLSYYPREYWLDSHLAVFVIRMQREAKGAPGETVMDARYLVKSLAAKKEQSLLPVR